MTCLCVYLQKTSIKTSVATDEDKQPKWNVTLNKRWNWSSCTKLALSASWTHGLIAQSVYIFIEHSGEHWWEQDIFCSFTTPQAFWQSSAPGALSTLVTSVVLYALTRATLMSPGKEETRVCGYIRSGFIHWALWRTLMRTKYFLFVHHTTSILAKFST